MTCSRCKRTTPADYVAEVGPYRLYLCSIHAATAVGRGTPVTPIEAVCRDSLSDIARGDFR